VRVRDGLLAFLVALALGCSAADPDSNGGRTTTSGGSSGASGAAGAGASGGSSGVGGIDNPTDPLAGMGGLGGMGGSGGGVDPEMCQSVSQTAEVMPGPVDIVWAIDTSGSMVDEVAAVNANITNFATMIQSAGIDHHVVMLASNDVALGTPLGDDAAHYLWMLSAVGSNNALQVMLDMYASYSSFLRPNAPLHLVVVTDDETWLPAAEFRTQMEMLSGKQFIFHAIASENASTDPMALPLPCTGACGIPIVCGAFAPGLEYYNLADATGGQKSSICAADWSTVFGPLQEAVIESVPLPCNYPIPMPPDGETLDPEKVNMELTAQGTATKMVIPRAPSEGDCMANQAWFYDDPAAPTQLLLCPATCELAQAGGTVDIAFGCETVVIVVE
jgi:hypothetical protein